MAPIKMQDGNRTHPITTVDEWKRSRRRGAELQFTSKANSGKYTDPKDGRGGWIEIGTFDPGTLVASGNFLFRAVLPAKPTLWQRIQGWFA